MKTLLGSIDSILSIRSQIGVALHPVFRVERSWSEDGRVAELEAEILPTPGIKPIKNILRLESAGVVPDADILVHSISKNKYPDKSLINGVSTKTNVEVLYKIDNEYYHVISVEEKVLTWDLQLRKLSNQRTSQ